MKKDADAIADCNHVIISEQSKSFDSRDNVALVYAYARSGRKSDCIPLIQTFSSKAINMSDEYEKACLYGLIGEIELSLKHFGNSNSNLNSCFFRSSFNVGNSPNHTRLSRPSKMVSSFAIYK